MKRILSIIMAALLIASLAACGSQPESKNNNTANAEAPANSAENASPANNADRFFPVGI